MAGKTESQQTLMNLIKVLTSNEKWWQQRMEKQKEMIALVVSKAKAQGKGECKTHVGKDLQSKKLVESTTDKE